VTFIVLKLLDGVFIDRLSHVKNLKTTLLETFDEGRGFDSLLALTSDVVDILLTLLHTSDVVLKGGHLISALGREETKKFSELSTVLSIFMDTKLDVLGEGFVESLVLILILSKFVEELEALQDDLLTDGLENLVLLKHLTRDVKRKILRINNTTDEAKVLRDQIAAIIHDEHTADVELDVVGLLARLKEIERSTTRNEEDSTELELTLNAEVLDSKVVLPIVGDGLVEGSVFLSGDLRGVADPKRLLLVDLDPLVSGDLLLLLLLLFLLLLILEDTILFLILLLLILHLSIIINLDLLLLGLVELDRILDELRVTLDDLLEFLLLKVSKLVLLELKDDASTTLDGLTVIRSDGELTTSAGLPNVLIIIVVLAVHSHVISNEVAGVETDTELTDHGNISGTLLELFHELLSTRAGDCTKAVDKVGLGHTDTSILNGESTIFLVGDDTDAHLRLGLELLLVSQAKVTDLIKSITAVADKLTKENILVAIESVDNQTQKLIKISSKLKLLCGSLRSSGGSSFCHSRFLCYT